MRDARLIVLSLALLAALSGRLVAQPLSCHGAQQPRQVAELLFGRDIGRKLGVSETAWARFLAREITPRFPDGLTVADVIGQWRDRASGTIVRERSKQVEIVLPGARDDQRRLDAIVATYKREFCQQSVATILRQACVAF